MPPIQPRVSVIIPTYNHGHLISECLESLLAQSIQEWEAIIVNNLSTDNTEKIVSGFNDERIKLVNFSNNGVIASSRNYGVKLSQSNYLAFLDSDDSWHPDKLKIILEILDGGHDIVCHAEKWVSKDGLNRIVRYGPTNRAIYNSLLFNGNCLSTSAVMMTRELFNSVGGFSEDPNFITAEDYDLWLKISRMGVKFYFVERVLGKYYLHGGNQSQFANRHYNAVINVIHWHFNNAIGNNFISQFSLRKRIALASCGCARMLQAKGDFKNAHEWIIKSLLEWPFAFKPWAALLLNFLKIRR